MYNSREIKVTERKQVKKDPFKKDMIYDPMGQWAHPGENTRIPSDTITMQGVPYPVWAQPNVGPGVMMHPGMNYNFPGARYVDEFPQIQDGGEYEDLELTDEEIQMYKNGGYIVEELPQAQNGKQLTLREKALQGSTRGLPPVAISESTQPVRKDPASYNKEYEAQVKLNQQKANIAANLIKEQKTIQQGVNSDGTFLSPGQLVDTYNRAASEPMSKVKALNPNDPNHLSFVAPENPGLSDYAGRAWDMITNPIAAFDYSVRTGDVGNMPWNYNRLEDNGLNLNPDNYLNQLNTMANPFKIGDKLARSNSSEEFMMNAMDALPYAGIAAKGLKAGYKFTKPVANKLWQTYRPVTDIEHLNRYNLKKNLGDKLTGDTNTGLFNEGVFNLKKFPNHLVKVENPLEIELSQAISGYKDMDLQKIMSNIPQDAPVGKVLKQIPIQKRFNALVLNKVEGTPSNKMAIDEYTDIPESHIGDMYNNIKKLRDENLAFDFKGNNYYYNPQTGFNLFDIAPYTKNTKGFENKHYDFWQDSVFGGGNPALYSEKQASSNIKKSLETKLLDDLAGAAQRARMDPEDVTYLISMMKRRIDNALLGLQDGGSIEEEMSDTEIELLKAQGYQIEEI